MSVTYTDPAVETNVQTDAFVPSYARGARRKKPVRTWMILAPIGALALIGGGAVMMFGGEPATAPLVEPETALIQPLAAQPAPLESSGLPDNASATIAAPTPATAPRVTLETPPAPPPAVQRRQAAPVARQAAPVVTPRVETASEPTSQEAYTAPAASTTVTPVATPPAPTISVAPLN